MEDKLKAGDSIVNDYTMIPPPLFPKPQTVCNIACLFIPLFPLRRGIGQLEIGGRVLNVYTMSLLAVPAVKN